MQTSRLKLQSLILNTAEISYCAVIPKHCIFDKQNYLSEAAVLIIFMFKIDMTRYLIFMSSIPKTINQLKLIYLFIYLSVERFANEAKYRRQ